MGMLLAIALFVGVPCAGFFVYRGKVKTGRMPKNTAFARFAAITLLPVLAYLGLYFVMTSFEQATGETPMTEGANPALILLGFGFVAWLLGLIAIIVGLRIGRPS